MTTLTRRPRTIGAILNIADGHMRAAEAKWSHLTQGDISSIREKHDLVVKVEERCSLPHLVAVQEVELQRARHVSPLTQDNPNEMRSTVYGTQRCSAGQQVMRLGETFEVITRSDRWFGGGGGEPNVDDQHRRAVAGLERRSAAEDGDVWNNPSADG